LSDRVDPTSRQVGIEVGFGQNDLSVNAVVSDFSVTNKFVHLARGHTNLGRGLFNTEHEVRSWRRV
jgi:hypothetical protein